MKKIYVLIALFTLHFNVLLAQDAAKLDSIEQSFKYRTGKISIGDGIATITVPPGFKYLDSVQSLKVLTEIWGNPKTENMTMGIILPEKQGILDEHGYVFNVQYDKIGYVKDDDANEIDYDELLTNMQAETKEESEQRQKEGYRAIDFVGWASKPYYDGSRHILHWAKEIKFGTDSVNTLNYNIRILGRKGVIVLNAIATMQEIAAVKADIPHVLNVVTFTDGNQYGDFDSKIDDVAAWTIGGLVAGKILAKVGFFALLLKFWKLIAVGFIAIGSFFRKMFKKKQAAAALEEENVTPHEVIEEEKLEEEKKDDKLLSE